MPTVGPGTGTAEVATLRPFSLPGRGSPGGVSTYGGVTPPVNATSLLSDNFNDGSIAAIWSGNYGITSEVSGRAVMTCDTGYSAFQTARAYRFDSILAQVFPPALNGGTTSTYAEMGLYSQAQPAGTDVVFYLDLVTNTLFPAMRTSYFDATSVGVTYNPVTMAWWRIRISGADVVWEVSADGSTWNFLRQAAAPAYILTATDVCVLFDTHRDNGTPNTFEIDNFNLQPSGATPVSSTLDLRWSVYSAVAQTIDLRWAVMSAISSEISLNWGVSSSVTSTLDARWAVMAAVAQVLDLRWGVLAAVAALLDSRWQVRQLATNGMELSWQVRTAVSSTLDVRWAVRQAVSSALDLRWAVLNTVSSPTDIRWQVRTLVANATEIRWSVSTLVTGALDVRWQVRSSVSNNLDLQWVSRAGVTGTLDLRYAIESDAVTENLFGSETPAFPNLNDATRYVLGTRFTVQEDGEITEGSWFFPATHPTPSGGAPENVTIGLFRVSDQAMLRSATFVVGTVTLGARNWRAWTAGALPVTAGQEFMVAIYTANHYVATTNYPWPKTSAEGGLIASTPNGWLLENATEIAFPTVASGNSANYSPDVTFVRAGETSTPVSSSIDLRWQVRSAVSQTADFRWQVRNSVSNATDLRWAVRVIVASALELQWQVRTGVAAALDARWAVLSSVSGSLDLRWTQRALAANALDLRWTTAGSVSQSLALQWTVRNAVTGALDLRWAVTIQINGSLGLLWIVRSRATGALQLLWVVEGEAAAKRSRIRAHLTERIKSRPQQVAPLKADLLW